MHCTQFLLCNWECTVHRGVMVTVECYICWEDRLVPVVSTTSPRLATQVFQWGLIVMVNCVSFWIYSGLDERWGIWLYAIGHGQMRKGWICWSCGFCWEGRQQPIIDFREILLCLYIFWFSDPRCLWLETNSSTFVNLWFMQTPVFK